jgi:hypothetical protein
MKELYAGLKLNENPVRPTNQNKALAMQLYLRPRRTLRNR